MDNKFTYPVTKETFHEYAESIFAPIRMGESVTTIWIPMSGRRKHNKFIIENIHLFNKELPEHDKYIFVYIEPLDLTEESILGYLRLMGKSLTEQVQKSNKVQQKILDGELKIFDDANASYSTLLDKLKSLITKIIKEGLDIVFFIGEFDELSFANKIFYNNLKSLWDNLKPNLHYVFLMRESVTNQENLRLWGELSEVVLQNIVFVPTLGGEDDNYIIDLLKKEFSLSPKRSQLDTIKEICGGHPYLLKEAFRILRNCFNNNLNEDEIRDLFYDNYELRWVIKKVFDIRTDDEKKILSKIALRETYNKNDYKEELGFLTNMGIIKIIEQELRPFNKLFSRTIQGFEKSDIQGKQGEHADIKLDSETGAIIFRGKTVEEKFTRQEYMVLTELLRVANKLVPREEVGNVLWGKDVYEKYSDWALDQLISKLRKKLKGLGIKDRFVTVRGKGYKFISED